jgi:hypothetical protein
VATDDLEPGGLSRIDVALAWIAVILLLGAIGFVIGATLSS